MKKILFIHIPKCAGVSMAETLSKHAEVLRIGPHAKYRDIFQQDVERSRDDYFVFSFVRNPWARLVSTFFYIMKGGRAEIDKQRREKYLTKYNGDFKSFVLDIENWFSIKEEDSIYPDKYIPHFRPQTEFICNEYGDVALDFLGRVEVIDEDFNRLCSSLALEKLRLAKANKGSHKPYYRYYDEQTRDIVAEYYAPDIKTFGYDFDVPESPGSLLGKAFTTFIKRG